jgi:hypothetical protein
MFKRGNTLSESSPINIPGFIGKPMVQELQKLPQTCDHWVKYKAVVRKQEGKSDTYDMRVYDEWEANKKCLKVSTYASLDANPELIQFTGWFDSKTKAVKIKYNQPTVKPA